MTNIVIFTLSRDGEMVFVILKDDLKVLKCNYDLFKVKLKNIFRKL